MATRCTHSFLFFGPGFPLGLTSPSTAKLALFFPFFAPPASSPAPGGGIATESSVPLGTGVFPFDASPPSASGDAVGALESESEEVDEDGGLESSAVSFSVLMSEVSVAGANLARREEDNFSRMMSDLDFLGRPPLGVEGEALCALAMVWACLSRLLCGREANREVAFLCTRGGNWGEVAMMVVVS